ncbi:MAG TPA: extracellular solute-binding protein, partial [Flavobacterium sp.]|nr:extracellular solute-binding protein [Flavobacterium sp.]
TKLTGDNRLAQSAAALGTSSNINRAADILQLLMLQSGVEFYDSSKSSITLDDGSSGSSGNGSAAERALQFYTQFSNPTSKAYTWNSKQPYSIDAFTQGKVTFLFGYSYLRPILTAKQSFLDYGVAPMPQASTIANKVNFGSYWADTVWNGSKNKSVAWDFLKFAASYTENQIYVNGTQQPSSRKDVLTEQQKNADMAVFADAVFSARTVVKPHSAQFDQILNDLIDDVSLNGISTQSALSDATTKLNLLLKKYPVSGSN